MHRGIKQVVGFLLNIALLSNQLSAELQQITFDSLEWVPNQIVGQNVTSGWNLISGNALVSSNGEGYGGGRALKIPANSATETRISRSVSWDASETIAFIDFQIKPAANPSNSLSSVHINGTQIAFQAAEGSNVGEIWVYQGNDQAANPESQPEEWIRTAGTYPIPQGATASDAYVRLTLRHDYARNIWDLFINEKLAAANLSFEGREPILQNLDFFGSEIGDTLVDNIAAVKDNLLFPDADKDGLPDAWEIEHGSNPNLYDRDALMPGTGRSFMEDYMSSLWPAVTGRGGPAVASSASIPALSLPQHRAVGSTKGSLSVGADGSAAYSVPIDIPKGTSGMEPKLALNYSSNSSNGLVGLGWSLSGLQSITRGPSSAAKDGAYDPMDFDGNDRFFLNGERLVCVSGTYGAPNSEYRTEIDSFARITAIGVGPASWKVETKSGLVVTFGDTASSKLTPPSGTLSWNVTRAQDATGNYYSVDYTRDESVGELDIINQRVSAIHYTGNDAASLSPYCHVVFDYEDRPDTGRAYSKYLGSSVTKRLSKIRVLTGSFVNHSYVLSYKNSFQSGRSILESVSKRVQDDASLAIPPTVFNYDGISESEALWRDPSGTSLPVFGIGLDATSAVNSTVVIPATDDTEIDLTGDVSRAFRLNTGDITVYSDTRIQFEFKSDKQISGAIIGLDDDALYQTNNTSSLCRIGGTGNIALAGSNNYSGSTAPYAVGSGWKTFDLPLSAIGLKKYLILMCVDNSITDGIDNAMFKNIRIYRSGSQQVGDVQPIRFPSLTDIPRMYDTNGKDLGVFSADIDADGLPDLADWRVTNYTDSNGVLTPATVGGVYRNTGSGFAMDTKMLPPVSAPLSCRSADTTAINYTQKHHFLGQPMDVNGDGKLDLLASVNIQKSGSVVKNEYAFYSWNGTAWVNLAGWELPFQLVGTSSGQSYGTRRDEHFQWVDLNSDGYQDLVVYTTAEGRLYNSVAAQLVAGGGVQLQIAAGSTSVAYINKGRNGPGWIRDDSMKLPEPLMVDQKDVGRRMIDIDGDGVLEMAESTNHTGTLVAHTYRMNAVGSYRWNSTPGLCDPPLDRYDLPVALDDEPNVYSGFVSTSMMIDLNGDGLVDTLGSSYGSLSFLDNSEPEYQLYALGATDDEVNAYLTSGVVPNWILLMFPNNSRINTGNSSLSTWKPTLSYNIEYPFVYWKNNAALSSGCELADINGDGLIDVFYSDANIANLACLNTGSGWLKRPAWGAPGTNRIFTSQANCEAGKRSSKLQDINGDGFPDLVTDILGGTPKVWYNNCRPEVLTSVTDGFGSELQVEYHRLNDPTPTPGFGSRVYEKFTGTLPAGHVAMVDSRLVVSAYSEPDGNGGRRYRSQRYGDLRYDRYNESSLGFGWVEAKDELNNQTTRAETSRAYPFGGSPILNRTWVDVASEDLSSVLPGVTVGMKCLSTETATYGEMPTQTGTDGIVIHRPVQTSSVKCLCDLNGNMVSRVTTTQNLADFDSYGFSTRSTAVSLDGVSVTTSNTYAHNVNATRWHLGRLLNTTVIKQGAAKPTIAKTSSFNYDSNTGLLVSETIESGNALSLTKAYSYDAYGNVVGTAITGSGITRSRTSIYDSQGRFVVAEYNPLGHTVTSNYDTQRSLLLSTTDISGKTTTFGYDDFGTLIHTWHPNGMQSGESTGYSNGNELPASVTALVVNPIKYFRAKQSSGSPVAKVYLDALGREIVAETTILRDANASGSSRYSNIYTITQYDLLGRKNLASEPFGAGEIPLVTRVRYDLLSRVIETIHPDGKSDVAQEFSTATIAGQPTTYSKVQNARSGTLERWEDQHGRLIQSRDPSGQVTTFRHDHENQILSVAIDGSTLLSNTFDLFGNKTSVTEVNSGTTSSIYNAFGETTSTTNARGQVTTFEYDVLGRPVRIQKPEGTYFTYYDGAAGSGLSKPWKTTGPDGYQETITYDNDSRPCSTTSVRYGETFSTSIRYDALGRPLTETDAGGLTVVHEYDPCYSFPVALRIGPGSEGSGTLLWQAGTFDSKGRPVTQTLAQGVATSATYHTGSGLLATMNSTRDGASLQAKSYAWDSIGNLISRTDAIAARAESFTYDNLNRVTGSTVAALSGSTISAVPPPATYSYATNGNLLSKPGLSNVTYGGPRPHAVTSAIVKGVTRGYNYNAAGYVTADGKRTYTWSSFGQLASLDYLSAPALQTFAGTTVYEASRVQSDFFFDAAGNRSRQIKQRISSDDSRKLEDTLYLGNYEREIHETKANASASPQVTKTVHRHTLGGFAVYTKTDSSNSSVARLTTILKDHLGSTDVILTSTWNGVEFANVEIERQSFDSWGERRAADTFVTYRASDSDAFRTSAHDYDRGYTGHEQLDDSGLIHMNGRIYDPELGRMLSPDPVVQVPEYSQNFNRYSYVMNNPLNMTDPTGFSWLSSAFHKLGSWLKGNWRTVVATVASIALGALSGGLALNFIVPALGFASGSLGAAIIAGAVGGFVSGMVSTAIMGGSFADIFRAGLMGGLMGGVISGLQYMGLEAMYNNMYGEDLKNLDVYEISDADKALKEGLANKNNYILGSARKITNWQELKGRFGKIWVNGQSNDYMRAIELGQKYTGSSKFLMLHNPTSGGLMDTVESSLDKISGASPMSKQVAKVLSLVDPKSTIYAHSQGTLLVRNAINMAARTGTNVTQFAVNFDGAAVNGVGTNLNFKMLGAKTLASFNTHSLDAVPNIVGYNAFTTPNPVRIIGSFVAAPLLGVGGEWSPHTYRGGGEYLRWFPDWY